MKPGDLTTLQSVKQWLGTDAINSSDSKLSFLISAASRFVLNYIQRTSLAKQTVEEIRDGYGNNFMVLRQWPVLSVQSVLFYGTSITTVASGNPRTAGFFTDEPPVGGGQQRLTLVGYRFPNCRSGITVNYEAGYVKTDDLFIPESAPYVLTTYSLWLDDQGVTYKNGTSLVWVAADPSAGQYTTDGNGGYTFAAADAGSEVLISYSYVPEDIQQAVNELVGERFKASSRIGENSKTLGGQETISFSTKDFNDFIETSLNPYRRIV